MGGVSGHRSFGARTHALSITTVLLLLSSFASAGHFKYATLSWQQVSGYGVQPNTVRFTLISSWRTDYSPYVSQAPSGAVSKGDVIRIQGLGNPVLEFGDGDNQLLTATVVSVNPVLVSWVGVSTVDHVYAAGSGPWLASFSGCCREDNLRNNAGEFWNLTSMVNLDPTKIRKWEGWAFSPRIANLPRTTVQANQQTSFYISATTPGLSPTQLPTGRNLAWSIGNSFDHGGATSVPINSPGLITITINSATGLVSVLAAPGVYSAAIIVRDLDQGTWTAVDFELEAADAAGGVAIQPVFDLSYPASPAQVPAYRALYVGFSDTFIIRFNETGAATALPAGAVVPAAASGRPGVVAGVLPAGAALAPLVVSVFPPGPGGVRGYDAAFTWTPAAAQANQTAACFAAYGNNSAPASPPLCVALDVATDPAPEWVGDGGCADAPDGSGTVCTPNASFTLSPPPTMGRPVTIVLVARDANIKDNITIDGVSLPVASNIAMTTQINIDQSGYTQVTRSFTWTPGPSDGGRVGSYCFQALGLQVNRLGLATPDNAAPKLCVQFQVQKCRYRVGRGEALIDIGRKFQISWLQLWALNKYIKRPEGYNITGSITFGDEIYVGQLIKTKRGDSLERIAARFGITLRQVLGMNQDVQPTVGLLLDQYICVVPNSCSQS